MALIEVTRPLDLSTLTSMSLYGAYVTLDQLLDLATTSRAKKRSKKGMSRLAGEFLARTRGQGIDLDEIRLYQPGDDVRSIDWKVTARKQKPHTKVFREERERPTLIVVDQTSSMFFGSKVRLKSVAAAEVAARVAWNTLALRDRVGGVVIGDTKIDIVKPFRSGKNVAKFLSLVAEANNVLSASTLQIDAGSSRLNDLPRQLKHMIHVNHRIFFISDFANVSQDVLNQLFTLQRHHQVEAAFVFDEIERTLPPANTYNVTDGATQIAFSSVRARNRELYRERFEGRLEGVRSASRSMGVPFHLVNTSESLEGVGFSG